MPAWGSATLSQALEGTHQSRHNQLVPVREFASRQQLLDRAVGKFKSGIGGSLKGIAVGPDRAPVGVYDRITNLQEGPHLAENRDPLIGLVGEEVSRSCCPHFRRPSVQYFKRYRSVEDAILCQEPSAIPLDR